MQENLDETIFGVGAGYIVHDFSGLSLWKNAYCENKGCLIEAVNNNTPERELNNISVRSLN